MAFSRWRKNAENGENSDLEKQGLLALKWTLITNDANLVA